MSSSSIVCYQRLLQIARIAGNYGGILHGEVVSNFLLSAPDEKELSGFPVFNLWFPTKIQCSEFCDEVRALPGVVVNSTLKLLMNHDHFRIQMTHSEFSNKSFGPFFSFGSCDATMFACTYISAGITQVLSEEKTSPEPNMVKVAAVVVASLAIFTGISYLLELKF